jgi:hypothetical protein
VVRRAQALRRAHHEGLESCAGVVGANAFLLLDAGRLFEQVVVRHFRVAFTRAADVDYLES